MLIQIVSGTLGHRKMVRVDSSLPRVCSHFTKINLLQMQPVVKQCQFHLFIRAFAHSTKKYRIPANHESSFFFFFETLKKIKMSKTEILLNIR